mmetsp:Transcript_6668/g.9868  ORF Transcript_6668/g.9868 Transcript_6668/m.9868 type:complete len:661 (+) Transcript_6668:4397-6379(+)
MKDEGTTSPKEERSESILVLVRIRPILQKEHHCRGKTLAVSALGNNTIVISSPSKTLTCQYDHVFNPSSTQTDIYSKVSFIVKDALSGINGTILGYGQTCSGKTHTIFGSETSNDTRSNRFSSPVLPPNAGIIPRCINQLFKQLSHAGDLGNSSFTVYASFAQVYNEQIFDMLKDPMRNNPLEIHEEQRNDATGGVYVSGLSEYAVKNTSECLALVRLGERNRAIRETDMNNESSRSHSIFQIILEQIRDVQIDGARPNEKKVLRSKLSLVDLAGSEKWGNSMENEQHILELTNINLSLYTLGRCISALAKKSIRGGTAHIPFRDSKLTRLLQDSLGGNSRTIVIATLSPALDCVEESISTLRFADHANKVMTCARVNEKTPLDHTVVEELKTEISRLHSLLEQNGIDYRKGKQDTIENTVCSDYYSADSADRLGKMEASDGSADSCNTMEKLREENCVLRKRLGLSTQQEATNFVEGDKPAHEGKNCPILEEAQSRDSIFGDVISDDQVMAAQQLAESCSKTTMTVQNMKGLVYTFFAKELEEEILIQRFKQLLHTQEKEETIITPTDSFEPRRETCSHSNVQKENRSSFSSSLKERLKLKSRSQAVIPFEEEAPADEEKSKAMIKTSKAKLKKKIKIHNFLFRKEKKFMASMRDMKSV